MLYCDAGVTWASTMLFSSGAMLGPSLHADTGPYGPHILALLIHCLPVELVQAETVPGHHRASREVGTLFFSQTKSPVAQPV